jgi:hypothetical protein
MDILWILITNTKILELLIRFDAHSQDRYWSTLKSYNIIILSNKLPLLGKVIWSYSIANRIYWESYAVIIVGIVID